MDRFDIPSYASQALKRLCEAGYEAWLVGGCVRDHLLGRVPKDYDVATAALPWETLTVFAGEKVLETGLKHGTVTVILDGYPLEVTTFRIDGAYSDARHPDRVAFSRSLAEDAARRDFTINAMAYNPDRGLWDGFGGREDLERRLIRCVGDPEARFREDALRILRGFRFASELDFTLETATLEAACRTAPLLKQIAAERVTAEVSRLLTGPGAGRVIRQAGPVLSVLFPALFSEAGDLPEILSRLGDGLDRAPDSLPVRLAVLICGAADSGSATEAGAVPGSGVPDRLRLSRRVREETEALLRRRNVPLRAEPERILRLLSRYGVDGFFALLDFRKAIDPEEEELCWIRLLAVKLLDHHPCLSVKDLAVDGRALLSLGFRGAAVGRAQRRLLEQVLSGTLPNEREAMLRFLREAEGARDG